MHMYFFFLLFGLTHIYFLVIAKKTVIEIRIVFYPIFPLHNLTVLIVPFLSVLFLDRLYRSYNLY